MKTSPQNRSARPAVRKVSASIRFRGIRYATLPTKTKVDGLLARDAGEAEELLFLVEATQTFFWNAVRNLELHLGFEIDSSQDFENVSIEGLKASPGAPV
ncbi:MAG: hypothetical protein ACYCSP_12465 [Acidobacteriaceae bacterium]